MKNILLMLIILVPLSCGQWKVTTYKPKKYAFIPGGKNPGQVEIKTDEFGLEKLSLHVAVYNDKICTADNELHRVQVIEPDGDVKLVIGSLTHVDTKKVKAAKFNFGKIGSIAIDDDDNIYIQNRLAQFRGPNIQWQSEPIKFSPSFVLVFNDEGELLYTLGQRGVPDIPFYHIESLNVDENNRLIVVSRSIDSWSVFRYKGKERDFYINLGKLEFVEKEGTETFQGKIENVRIFRNGEEFLISVAYYHGLRLKYIKVYKYSISKDKIIRTVVQIPDPNNVLFDIIDDSYIYFWNVSDETVKFLVCNLEGNIVYNLRLDFDDKKRYYTKLIADESGKLFTYNITRKGIEIVRWE